MRLKTSFSNYILLISYLKICEIVFAFEDLEAFPTRVTERNDSFKSNLRSQKKTFSTTSNYLIDKEISVMSDSINENETVDFIEQKLQRTVSGVSLSREISKIPEKSSVFLTLEGSFCKTDDIYGSNNCEFQWSDVIVGAIEFKEGITIDETHEIQGVFKLKKIIDWNFSCPACGADCVLHIPIIEKSITLHLPQCPLVPKDGPTTKLKKSFTWKLPSESPVHGMKVAVDGVILLKSKVDSATLAELTINAIAK